MCSEWVSAGGWLVIADGEVLIGRTLASVGGGSFLVS